MSHCMCANVTLMARGIRYNQAIFHISVIALGYKSP